MSIEFGIDYVARDNLKELVKRVEQAEKAYKKLLDTVDSLQEENKDNLKTNRDLLKAQDKLAKARTAEAEQILKIRAQINKINKDTRDRIKLAQDEETITKTQVKSIKDLEKVTNALINKRKNLNLTTREGLKEYKALTTRIRENNAELLKQDAQIGRNSRNVGGYAGAVASAAKKVALFGAAILTLQRSLSGTVNILSQTSDALTDIQKTTGLSAKEVEVLFEQLKKIDTRTTVEGLTSIATAAGRIGVRKDEIIGFVTTVDKAFLGLGDSLTGTAEEIALDLAKIANVLGVEDQFGIAEGIERVGSTVNELGQNTKATEGSIVDFLKRIQGIGGVANISAADLAGLGATLDSAGISAEVSATAVSKLISELAKDLPKFADLAGESLEKFSEIAEKDANEAFLLVLQSAKSSREGLVGLAETLEDLGINQQRAAAVAGTLVNNIDDLRANQELANKAFEENISLAKEAKLRNENLAAEIEKLGNDFKKLVTETGAIDFLKQLVIGFREVLSQAVNIGKALLATVAGFVSYTLAVNIAAIATKNWTTATIIGRKAMALFNIVIKANPIGLLVGALTAAATALFIFKKNAEKATKSQSALNKEIEKAKNLAEDTKSIEERAKIVEKLNKRQLDKLKRDAEAQKRIFEDIKSELDLLQKKREDSAKIVDSEEPVGALDFLEARTVLVQQESEEVQKVEALKKKNAESELARLNSIIERTNRILGLKEEEKKQAQESIKLTEEQKKAQEERIEEEIKANEAINKSRLDSLNERLALERDAVERAEEERATLSEQAEAILDERLLTSTEKFEIAQFEQTLILKKALEQNLISQEEYNAAVAALDQDATQRKIDLSKSTANVIASTFELALVSITDFSVGAEKRLKSFWKSFVDLALAAIQKVLVQLALIKLLDIGLFGSGSIAKAIGGIVGFADGGPTGTQKDRVIRVNDGPGNKQEFVMPGDATSAFGINTLNKMRSVKTKQQAKEFLNSPETYKYINSSKNTSGSYQDGGLVTAGLPTSNNDDLLGSLQDLTKTVAITSVRNSEAIDGLKNHIVGLSKESVAIAAREGNTSLAIRND